MVNITAKAKDKFIEQLVKMTNSLGQGEGFSRSAEIVPSAAERERVFSALFQGPNGLKRVAFAMQVPLKNRLDYVAVGRKLILVDELPQGEIPAYDLDMPEFGAVKIAARGTAPLHQANIKRVEFPTFPISVDVTVKWEEIQIRRYPAFDRAKERAAIAVAIAEDVEIFSLLAAAAATNTAFVTGVSGALTRVMLADGFGAITGRQLAVGAYVMNPARYADILKWAAADIDQVSLNVIVETGMFGVLFGSKLIISTRCPYKRVYVTTTPDKLGRLPERKAVEIKIFDNIPQNQYDVVAWEQVGMGIHNAGGSQELQWA